MLGEIRGEVRFKEMLSFHTSLRIGGPADIFVVPQDIDDIRHALFFAEREQLPVGVTDGAIGDYVSAVYFLHPDGTIGECKPATGGFSYEQFSFPAGAVLVGARLRFHRRPNSEIQKDIKQRLKHKKQTQPLALASAGCVWKNPP